MLAAISVFGGDTRASADPAAAEPIKEPASTADCQAGLAQIRDRLAALEAQIAHARKSGLDTAYEEVTVFAAREFERYINWDLAHTQELARIFGRCNLVGTNGPQLAAAQPGEEVADTLMILANAMAELERVQKNPAARQPVPPLPGSPRLAGDYWYQDGRPVFLSTFIAMPQGAGYGQAYGWVPSLYLSLRNLTGEDMALGSRSLDEIKRRAESYGRNGAAFEVFFDNSRPRWATDKYPDITTGQRQMIGYDIDHPKVREMWQHYLAQVIPLINAGGQGRAIYMLANEPTWFTTIPSWSTGPVSDYTWKRFQAWLARRYAHSLPALNQRWGTQFRSFEAVRLELPMKIVGNKGSASWYDWCRFNLDRVNDWFRFLSAEIKKHDPQARCTIKLSSSLNISTEFEKGSGLDFETLTTDVQDFSGADADVEPLCRFRRVRHPVWAEQYALDWEPQSIQYDFLKSLASQKPIADCEYHGLSSVSWRAPDLGQDYVRAVLWLAHLHGLALNECWYLARHQDGSLIGDWCVGDVFGSVALQPRAADAYGRTMKELNAYAPEIIALAKTPGPVRLFYSTDAAIQSPSFQAATLRTYEAAYFLSVPLGFATERMLSAAKLSELREYPLLIVPSATHVKDSAIAALQRYLKSGGKLTLLGRICVAI
jgi:beta-galactosidase